VVDLQEDEHFRRLNVELLSIAPDPVDAWREEGGAMGIREFETVLSDEGNQVARRYGVMRWAAATGEPGHTFILIDESGRVTWLQDYGAPEHGGIMYVLPKEIVRIVGDRV
jgi:peroxiredoxin